MLKTTEGDMGILPNNLFFVARLATGDMKVRKNVIVKIFERVSILNGVLFFCNLENYNFLKLFLKILKTKM